jgi:predicted small lipoprotein YifL
VRVRDILLVGLLLAALGLSACGVRGPLEPAPGDGSNDDKPTVLDPIVE